MVFKVALLRLAALPGGSTKEEEEEGGSEAAAAAVAPGGAAEDEGTFTAERGRGESPPPVAAPCFTPAFVGEVVAWVCTTGMGMGCA